MLIPKVAREVKRIAGTDMLSRMKTLPRPNAVDPCSVAPRCVRCKAVRRARLPLACGAQRACINVRRQPPWLT